MNRRRFLASPALLGAGALLPGAAPRRVAPRFRLGTVTYNLARNWDLDTLISTCRKGGVQGVELRTTHKHGVEPTLNAEQRRAVQAKFKNSGVELWGLGTTCEFHSPDPAEVKRQVRIAGDFCRLTHDVGGRGIKVRPNRLPKGVPPEKTLEQIGKTLRAVGEIGAGLGVEIWVEIHGRGTSEPANMRKIMDHCGHENVGVCWNCNQADIKDGSIKESFELLKKKILSVHIHDLWDNYPYREFFACLTSIGYDRYTLMELPGVQEAPGAKEPRAAIRFMRGYRMLWEELAG